MVAWLQEVGGGHLDADRVEVHRRGERGYGPPDIVGRGGVLASQTLCGLRIGVRDVLGTRLAVRE